MTGVQTCALPIYTSLRRHKLYHNQEIEINQHRHIKSLVYTRAWESTTSNTRLWLPGCLKNEKGEGSFYRRKAMHACVTLVIPKISLLPWAPSKREQNFGHNKKRLKKRGKWSFFSEKMEEKRGFYDRVWA